MRFKVLIPPFPGSHAGSRKKTGVDKKRVERVLINAASESGLCRVFYCAKGPRLVLVLA